MSNAKLASLGVIDPAESRSGIHFEIDLLIDVILAIFIEYLAVTGAPCGFSGRVKDGNFCLKAKINISFNF